MKFAFDNFIPCRYQACCILTDYKLLGQYNRRFVNSDYKIGHWFSFMPYAV